MYKYLENLVDVWLKVGVNIQPNQLLYVTIPSEYISLKDIFDKKTKQLKGMEVIYQFTDDYDQLLEKYKNNYQIYDSYLSEITSKKLSLLEQNCVFFEAKRGIDFFDEEKKQELQQLKQIEKKYNLKFRNEKRKVGNIVSCKTVIPTKYWAECIFPEELRPLDKLWEVYLQITLANFDNAVEIWNRRINEIQERVKYLDQQQFKSLYFKTDKTQLYVELAENHKWTGGCEITEKGIRYMPNFPTQEIFTAPKKTGITGIMHNTKPLNYSGRLINEFSLHFEKGKILDYCATDNKSILDEIINLDENNRYPGEIAILPGETEISKTNIIFQTTLLDENAACHLAIGCAYPCSINHKIGYGRKEFERLGINYSNYHVDVMFGDSRVTITASSNNNEEILLMENGEWRV